MRIQRCVGMILLSIIVLAAARTAPVRAEAPDHVPGQVVVKLAPDSGVDVATINLDYGTSTITGLLNSSDIFLLDVPSDTSAEQLVEDMADDARLLYAELNYINETPGESNTDRTYGWGGEDEAPRYGQDAVDVLQLDAAHEMSRGAGTVVAVLDTGAQLAHPALADRWSLLGYDFIDNDLIPEDERNGQDDDGDGYVDEAYGHGTHVAGIVNLTAPDATLMALRVLNADGRGNAFTTANAIMYAANNGADVINLSLGTPYRSALLRDAVAQAAQQGVAVVAAAGNLNADVAQYPAAEACALAITSIDGKQKKSSFASYGTWIDVVAPGESIYSTFPIDGYAWWSGTSMATPFVAGHAALLRSAGTDESLHELGTLIGGTATSVDNKNPDYRGLLGAGQIDVVAGLEAQASATPSADHDLYAGCAE